MAKPRQAGTRVQRRHARCLEQRAIRSGKWGEWETTALPDGLPGQTAGGWLRQIRQVAKNDLYVALVRPVETKWGRVHHLAIRTASSLEPPWRDKQRIKDELFGPEFVAVEVMPRQSRLVDEADMYHMWVLPEGMALPFGISEEDGG